MMRLMLGLSLMATGVICTCKIFHHCNELHKLIAAVSMKTKKFKKKCVSARPAMKPDLCTKFHDTVVLN